MIELSYNIIINKYILVFMNFFCQMIAPKIPHETIGRR